MRQVASTPSSSADSESRRIKLPPSGTWHRREGEEERLWKCRACLTLAILALGVTVPIAMQTDNVVVPSIGGVLAIFFYGLYLALSFGSTTWAALGCSRASADLGATLQQYIDTCKAARPTYNVKVSGYHWYTPSSKYDADEEPARKKYTYFEKGSLDFGRAEDRSAFDGVDIGAARLVSVGSTVTIEPGDDASRNEFSQRISRFKMSHVKRDTEQEFEESKGVAPLLDVQLLAAGGCGDWWCCAALGLELARLLGFVLILLGLYELVARVFSASVHSCELKFEKAIYMKPEDEAITAPA